MKKLLILAVAGSLALSGCEWGGIGSGGDNGSSGEIKAYDINPVARDQVKEGGTLRWGINDFPTQWNVGHTDGNNAITRKVVDALLPEPFRSDEKSVISPNPDYLVEGKVTAKSPKQVVTLTLNPKARWSDGKPVTWADYDAQWRALNGRDQAFRVSGVTGYQDIESIAKGKDAYEAVITFTRPFADWQSLFSPLYPKAATGTPEQFNTGWVNKIPVTAGPFRFQGLDQAARSVTLVRDDSWWGEKAKLDQIVFRAMEHDALTSALARREIDAFDVGPTAADYDKARNASGAVVRQAAGSDFRHLLLNGESPVLKEAKVRQALLKGIDRQAIAEADLKGLDWPVRLLNNRFFMNTQEGYRDNAGDLGDYDVARAEEQLDAAGWKMSGQTRTKDGKELSLRFVMPSGLQLTKSEGELLRSMLGKIGVKVTLQAVPSEEFFTKYIIPGNYDITAFAYTGTSFPVSSSYSLYANATEGVTGKQWGNNLARIGSAEIDAAMEKATAALDPATARDETNAADTLIWQAVNLITLYQRPQKVAVKETLANIGARGFYDLKYQDIGFTG